MSLVDSIEPYCTVEEANEVLGTQSPWVSTPTEGKEAALRQGKMYIDFNYTCAVDDPPQDNIKIANALLANEMLTQSLWERQDNLGPVKSTSVKAGSVESSKSYAVESSSSNWKDPFESITALLAQDNVCSLTKGQSLVQSNNMRF